MAQWKSRSGSAGARGLARRRLLLAGLAATLSAVVATSGRGETPVAAVEVEGGLLTLRAENSPLADVLLRVGAAAGFRTVLHGRLASSVTVSLCRVPLAEAIARLAGRHSVAAIYEPQDGPAGERITELWVFEAGEGAGHGAHVTQPPSRPGEVETASGPAEEDSGIEILRGIRSYGEDEAVEHLLRVVRQDADPFLRGQAVVELTRIGSPAAVEAMAAALGDSDSAVRRQAVEGLGRIGSGYAVQLLGQAVIGDRDPSVRLAGVAALADQQSEAAEAFLASAAGDADEQVQTLASQALARR